MTTDTTELTAARAQRRNASPYAGFGAALQTWLLRADRSQKELAKALAVDPSAPDEARAAALHRAAGISAGARPAGTRVGAWASGGVDQAAFQDRGRTCTRRRARL